MIDDTSILIQQTFHQFWVSKSGTSKRVAMSGRIRAVGGSSICTILDGTPISQYLGASYGLASGRRIADGNLWFYRVFIFDLDRAESLKDFWI